MNRYSDLPAIDTRLHVRLELEPVGTPDISVTVGTWQQHCVLSDICVFDHQINLLEPFAVVVELRNKQYSLDTETAVIVRLCVDGIDIIPKYDYLVRYHNDHDYQDPTSYVGFNGKWTLTFDQAFYHWLHLHSGQGWLFG